MKYVCKIHPRYKGKLQPRVSCVGCWWMYVSEHMWDKVLPMLKEVA